MGCSKMFKKMWRPSVILLMGFLLVGTSLKVSANPVPDSDSNTSERAKSLTDDLQNGVSEAKDFFQRAKNTFTGKADDKENKGLSTWELIGVIAAAVVILLLIPCCIGYCLCECVKELVCCICCCGCCRD